MNENPKGKKEIMYRPIKKQYSTNIGVSKRGVAIIILLISIVVGLRIYLGRDLKKVNTDKYKDNINTTLKENSQNNTMTQPILPYK